MLRNSRNSPAHQKTLRPKWTWLNQRTAQRPSLRGGRHGLRHAPRTPVVLRHGVEEVRATAEPDPRGPVGIGRPGLGADRNRRMALWRCTGVAVVNSLRGQPTWTGAALLHCPRVGSQDTFPSVDRLTLFAGAGFRFAGVRKTCSGMTGLGFNSAMWQSWLGLRGVPHGGVWTWVSPHHNYIHSATQKKSSNE